MLFTTSWDDGYTLDVRIAHLLEQHGLKGTFYVCPKEQHDKTMLSEGEIRTLSKTQEVGAHSLTHQKLSLLSAEEALREIRGSKEWVEQVTGKSCNMFCYPKGQWNKSVKSLVQEAGFHGARTTQLWQFVCQDPFAAPVSLQVVPFPFRKSYRPIWKILDPLGPLRASWKVLNTNTIPLSARSSWLGMATALFDRALADQRSLFHLYGHAHEIERFGMWDDLSRFCAHVQKSTVQCVTNSELIQKITSPA
ncbi:MAG: polysaccharide deacetylase family protein [Candidatus Peribacteraceae bacterium]|jgi:peptidoglycan/xylan/chitin deacetylase (PgdA/CDA1 family)